MKVELSRRQHQSRHQGMYSRHWFFSAFRIDGNGTSVCSRPGLFPLVRRVLFAPLADVDGTCSRTRPRVTAAPSIYRRRSRPFLRKNPEVNVHVLEPAVIAMPSQFCDRANLLSGSQIYGPFLGHPLTKPSLRPRWGRNSYCGHAIL
jgi:hypothetical protein